MERVARWGDDNGSESDTIASYALADADAVARLFLPLVSRMNDERISWMEYIRRRRKSYDLDGYSEWAAISELSGNGDSEDDLDVYSAPGSADLGTIQAVTSVLEAYCGDGPQWNLHPDPVFGYSQSLYTGRHLAEIWTTRSFPGRVWSDDCGVALASPAYADSIFVSGPARLIDRLHSRKVEIFRVARSHRLPAMIL